MYRDFDFRSIENILINEMSWTWMLLSFPFGILAQMFRGWRWRQTLEPVGEYPRSSTSVNSIFLSYAASLVIPRIGEFTRCGVLKRYDGVSFPKALGTVVYRKSHRHAAHAVCHHADTADADESVHDILLKDRHKHGFYHQPVLNHRLYRNRSMRHSRNFLDSHTAEKALKYIIR